MSYRSPLSGALGLGSAHSGSLHWWLQRVSAVLLVPLTFWLLILLDSILNSGYLETVAWLREPINGVAILAWILVVFYHASTGVQVVIEDYVSQEAVKIIAIWIAHLFFFLLAVTAVIAVIKIIAAG